VAEAVDGARGARRSALRFVVLVGVVSLFADATYEGARSIAGPFLATLGANGTVVGIVAGLGELIMIAADRRGTAYGVFNAVYGIMWFAGSALLGILYDVSVGWLVGASIVIQLAAVPLLFAVRGAGRSPAEAVPRP